MTKESSLMMRSLRTCLATFNKVGRRRSKKNKRKSKNKKQGKKVIKVDGRLFHSIKEYRDYCQANNKSPFDDDWASSSGNKKTKAGFKKKNSSNYTSAVGHGNLGSRSYSSYTTVGVCKHKPERVTEIFNIPVYGATKHKLKSEIKDSKYDEKTLVVNCSGTTLGLKTSNNPVKCSPDWFDISSIRPRVTPPQELCLNWNDFGKPPVGFDFWQKLVEALKAQQNELEQIIFCCTGGHGRTGTGMAAMLIASGMTSNEAVNLIRGSYCDDAVETIGQEEYLDSMSVRLYDRV